MNLEQLTYRNDLAVELITTLAQQNAIYTPASLVKHAFELADQTCARIKADYDKAVEELNTKTKAARAARQAEFDTLVGGTASHDGQINKTDQRDPRKHTEAHHPLRRRDDKVEVRELSVEQAIDMIAALFDEKR